jgi:hypothetical protein
MAVQTFSRHLFDGVAEPDKQFAMVRSHIARLRAADAAWTMSTVYIYVERNLGFEAEHHKMNLQKEPNVVFRMDPESDRCGIYTTQNIKHAMAMLLNTMLREHRVNVRNPLVTADQATKTRLRDQMYVYGYQFKVAPNPFSQDKCCLSGKVGGMKDDLVVALQLGIYFTELDSQRHNAVSM